MGPNVQTLVILFILVVLLFGGRGRISSIMGDFAKGIKSFKKGMAEDDEATSDTSRPVAEVEHTHSVEAESTKRDRTEA